MATRLEGPPLSHMWWKESRIFFTQQEWVCDKSEQEKWNDTQPKIDITLQSTYQILWAHNNFFFSPTLNVDDWTLQWSLKPSSLVSHLELVSWIISDVQFESIIIQAQLLMLLYCRPFEVVNNSRKRNEIQSATTRQHTVHKVNLMARKGILHRYFSGEICWGLSHTTQIIIWAALWLLEKHLKVYLWSIINM